MTADPADWSPPDDAPCIDAAHHGVQFTPSRLDLWTGAYTDDYDAGREATAVCATCPHRDPCLTASVARNEQHSIWGAAGGSRRRALRRHWQTPTWDAAVAAHWRRVDHQPAKPGDDQLLAAYGDDARHGRRATFAKGCRCDPCSLAAGLEGQFAKLHTHPPKAA